MISKFQHHIIFGIQCDPKKMDTHIYYTNKNVTHLGSREELETSCMWDEQGV